MEIKLNFVQDSNGLYFLKYFPCYIAIILRDAVNKTWISTFLKDFSHTLPLFLELIVTFITFTAS